MKFKRKDNEFKPITVEVTIETEDEYGLFLAANIVLHEVLTTETLKHDEFLVIKRLIHGIANAAIKTNN